MPLRRGYQLVKRYYEYILYSDRLWCFYVCFNSFCRLSFSLWAILYLCTFFQGEYEYEFTECDSAGGRWRVPVPRKPDQCEATGLASVRQRKCGMFLTFFKVVLQSVLLELTIRTPRC